MFRIRLRRSSPETDTLRTPGQISPECAFFNTESSGAFLSGAAKDEHGADTRQEWEPCIC